MIKILVSDVLSEEGLKVFKESKELTVDVKTDLKPDALKEIIKDYDALVVRSATKVTKEIIQAAEKLKAVSYTHLTLPTILRV